ERDEAVLRVRDTGPGIAPDFLPHIFDLFAQGDRSLARSAGGLGIGLTMVKRLVEMHGGSVTACSDGPGQGSEFVVRLPLCSPDAGVAAGGSEPAAVPAQEAAPAAGRKVLVIEDNRDAAETLRDLLERWGHAVGMAHSGMDGIDLARTFRPDVVLLDV